MTKAIMKDRKLILFIFLFVETFYLLTNQGLPNVFVHVKATHAITEAVKNSLANYAFSKETTENDCDETSYIPVEE